jgi:hypothetical protein
MTTPNLLLVWSSQNIKVDDHAKFSFSLIIANINTIKQTHHNQLFTINLFLLAFITTKTFSLKTTNKQTFSIPELRSFEFSIAPGDT